MGNTRILVPLEDRDLTQAILVHAKPLLGKDDQVVLLRAVDPAIRELGEREREVSSARDDLEQVCDSLRRDGVHATADWVEADDPAQAIVDRAVELRASLVLQASHARADLKRWVRGSITERVLRTSPVPLLMFNPWNELRPFSKILVALDGSERAERILPLVTWVARIYASEVVLLHVAPPPSQEGSIHGLGAGRLEAVRADLARDGLRARVRIDTAANVPLAIVEAAVAEEADLVAMTTHGASALDDWPFGSVSTQVFRHSPAPLLIKRVATLTAPPAPVLELLPEPEVRAEQARPLRRVLVPLDGSRLAETVLRTLPTLLGESSSAELVLVRVVPGGDDELELSARRDALTDAQDDVAGVRSELEAKGHTVRSRVLRGDPAGRVLQVVAEAKPDLVVMSSHGRSGVARWLRGSVAERVLRRCSAPILLCNPTGLRSSTWDPGAPLRRILVPLDGSERAAAVLPHVLRLARTHGATVVLLRVEERPGDENLEQSLEPWRRELLEAEVPVEVEVASGPVVEAIIDAAGAADLVAMTTHGRTGVARWWFGSVSEMILRHCSRPLLLVRA